MKKDKKFLGLGRNVFVAGKDSSISQNLTKLAPCTVVVVK